MFMFSPSLQDSCSYMSSKMSEFHDHVMMLLIGIVTMVCYLFFINTTSGLFGRTMKSSESLEAIWTIVPCVILSVIAAPSLVILYMSDEMSDPLMTVKIIGHQWYWSYEYDSSAVTAIDSYMVPSVNNRLLEVDKEMIIPMDCEIRVIVTSSDVIHSWAVPSLGVKMDAIPGRLNQFGVSTSRVGRYYGQCSEICGANHSFMPIVVESVPLASFLKTGA